MSVVGHAGAGVWGARAIAGAIRRALDTDRPLVIGALLVAEVATLVFFLGVGVALLVSVTDQPRSVVWLASGTFLAAAGGAAVWVAEAVTRLRWRGERAGRATIAPAPSGVTSTAVLRSRAALVTPWGLGLVPVVWALVMALATLEAPWVAFAFTAGALAMATRLAPLVLRRAVPGGVYLTPAGVELRWGVTTTTVPWHDLPPSPVGEAPRGFPRTPHTTERRAFPVDMPHDVADRVDRDVVLAPTTYLALTAPQLWALVELGRTQRHLRHHFGTPRSLGWHVEPLPPPGT